LGISQEKLAELAGVSAKMINSIEGGRTWVSDKTLLRLAEALRVEPFQLLTPVARKGLKDGSILASDLLGNLRQNIKDDIDVHFDRFIQQETGTGDISTGH
jgi:transcriptional regulator with XRE-family HTH domain